MTNELNPVTAPDNTPAVFETMVDSVAVSTQKAYRQAMTLLENYYNEQGWLFYPVNGEELPSPSLFLQQVLSYLRHLADEGKTLSTLNKTLAAVKHHTSFDNPPMSGVLYTKPVKAFMSGVARQGREHIPRKADTLTVDELSAVYRYLGQGETVRSIRDRALISLGVATALRSANIGLLNLSDVNRAVTIDGLNVFVRYSKTDQTGKGTLIPVARAYNRLVDPVHAVNAWVKVLASFGYTKDAYPHFPLFPVVRGNRAVHHARMKHPNITITDLLRGVLVDAGVRTVEEARAVSSHSLRATFITLSNQAGVAEKDIAIVSGHKNMTTLRSYDRTTAEKAAQADYLTV